MNAIKKMLSAGVLNSLVLLLVCSSVNQMSMWFFHQPEMPTGAEVLKKHQNGKSNLCCDCLIARQRCFLCAQNKPLLRKENSVKIMLTDKKDWGNEIF